MKKLEIPELQKQEYLKFQNRKSVLSLMRSADDFSVSDIAARLDLSRQTVAKILRFLVDKDLVISKGIGSAGKSGGVPPERFGVNFTKKFIVVLAHYREIVVKLINFDGTILDEQRCKISGSVKSSEWFEQLRILVQSLKLPPDEAKIGGVAMAFPGAIDSGREQLKFNLYFREWDSNINLGENLRSIFPNCSLIHICNIGRISAQAELWNNTGDLLQKRVFVLYTNHGITGAQLNYGRLNEGVNSLIGEVGHMVIASDDQEECFCGNQGCLERQVNITHLRKRISKDLSNYPDSPLNGVSIQELTLKQIFKFSAAGDELCRREVIRLAELFARLLRNLSLCCDPELIIFQGRFAGADESFKQHIISFLKSFRYYAPELSFAIEYDTRPLEELETKGALYALSKRFFENEALYQD